MRLLSCLLLMVVLSEADASGPARSFRSLPAKTRAFSITENDTLTYKIFLALDGQNQPLYFFRNVFTPVCYTNECKPVHIDLYWDLLGNYERYEMPSGKVLTKVDHDEFKPADYEKLQDILVKPASIFADLKMEDLISKGTDNLSDSVDAKTGATLKTIKNEVIDGAVYTCFTLWHIAHGKIVTDKMRKIIDSYADDKLLHNFLKSDNYHYQYWAMEKVLDANGQVRKGYEADLTGIMDGKNIFAARTAVLKTGNAFYQTAGRISWLWNLYDRASYALQIAILKRMISLPLTTLINDQIAGQLADSNKEQQKLKLEILRNQTRLSDKARTILSAY